jgi:hypothetical protein
MQIAITFSSYEYSRKAFQIAVTIANDPIEMKSHWIGHRQAEGLLYVNFPDHC